MAIAVAKKSHAGADGDSDDVGCQSGVGTGQDQCKRVGIEQLHLIGCRSWSQGPCTSFLEVCLIELD